MGKLSKQIEANCCGNLMDIGKKEQLVTDIAEMEHIYAVRCREVIELEEEIVELEEKLDRHGL